MHLLVYYVWVGMGAVPVRVAHLWSMIQDYYASEHVSTQLKA